MPNNRCYQSCQMGTEKFQKPLNQRESISEYGITKNGVNFVLCQKELREILYYVLQIDNCAQE